MVKAASRIGHHLVNVVRIGLCAMLPDIDLLIPLGPFIVSTTTTEIVFRMLERILLLI